MESGNLDTVTGQIISVFPKARLIALSTLSSTSIAGTTTELIQWDKPQDKEFVRLREGWYTKLTVEKRGDKWIAIAQEPAPKPKEKKPEPKIEVTPAALVMLKKWTALYIASNPPDGLDFRHGRQVILAAVRDDMRQLLRDAAPGSLTEERCPVCGSDDTYLRDNWDDEQGTNTVQFICDACHSSWNRTEKTSEPFDIFDGEGEPVPGPFDAELFDRWPGIFGGLV